MFDGVCNLCCGAVNFIIRRDPHQKFKFVSLQSDRAQQLIAEFEIPMAGMDSFVLLEGDTYYLRSEAALLVASKLGWPCSMFRFFAVIPVGVRDGIYSLIGRYRYRMFGRRATCMLPTADVAYRFLDEL
ncbi:MAG: putative DCC family thiol-disulfide oxidoreductase YuxK [Candidatus Azotimanducaceae bacterium]|jgi:predicted DCC family thiol-disulfide oxidoreductase YuxK